MILIKNIGIRIIAYFIFFSIFSFQSVFGQINEKQILEMYSLLDSSNYYTGIDDLKSLKFVKQAHSIAEKSKDHEEISQTCLFMGKCLYTLGAYKESLKYINKGIPLAKEHEDILMLSQFKELKLYNYSEIGLSNLALKELAEIENLLKTHDDEESKRLLSRIYGCLGEFYSENKDFKSAHKYVDKAIKIFPDKKTDEYVEIYEIYLMKGYLYLDEHNNDAAYYYFNKSYLNVPKTLCNYQQLIALGDYYYQTEKYQEALNYFLRSQKKLNDCNNGKSLFIIDIYYKIYNTYNRLGNKEEADIYFKKYSEESIKFKDVNKNNVQEVVNSILYEQDEIHQKKEKQNTIIIVIIMAISLMAIIYILCQYFKLKKNKKKIILEKEVQNTHLTKKNENLEKEVEDNKFIELIDLAKSNNPEFLVLFEELYPRLIHKLKEMNPQIRNGELSFCALAYLNFSTKDISKYTFVTIAAVQSRKNRFRKKYGIQSDRDFNTWIRELVDN